MDKREEETVKRFAAGHKSERKADRKPQQRREQESMRVRGGGGRVRREAEVKRDGCGRQEVLKPRHYSRTGSWPKMLIQRFNKSMPLEKYNESPHWVDVRGQRKCILKYFTLRGNNVLIYNSSPYTLGLSICVSYLTS